MADSFPSMIALPRPKYPIGSVPSQRVSINQHSTGAYINIVKGILKPEEWLRIRNSFMGPVIKMMERELHLSGKMVHVFLTRSLMTVKENECWFYFGPNL